MVGGFLLAFEHVFFVFFQLGEMRAAAQQAWDAAPICQCCLDPLHKLIQQRGQAHCAAQAKAAPEIRIGCSRPLADRNLHKYLHGGRSSRWDRSDSITRHALEEAALKPLERPLPPFRR